MKIDWTFTFYTMGFLCIVSAFVLSWGRLHIHFIDVDFVFNFLNGLGLFFWVITLVCLNKERKNNKENLSEKK